MAPPRSSTSSGWGELAAASRSAGAPLLSSPRSQGSDHLIEVDGVAHRFSRDDAGIVRAPAAALVVGVDVAPDDIVEVGTRLAVVEAMKMEIAVPAPVSGRVRDVFVARNVQVDAGTPLFRIEPVGDREAEQRSTDRIHLAALGLAKRPPTALDLVRASVLGFDVATSTARRLLGDVDQSDAGALEILGIFADLCCVAPERRDPDADAGETRGSREYLNTYLRSLDVEREGLPTWFRDRLLRALAHYGVHELEPSDELEEALLRIFIAQQRRDEQLPIVVALLESAASAADRAAGDARPADRGDPAAVPGDRQPGREASATSRFDRPHIDRARAEVVATMQQLAGELARLDRRPARRDWTELVACPLPLGPILAEDDLLADTESPGRARSRCSHGATTRSARSGRCARTDRNARRAAAAGTSTTGAPCTSSQSGPDDDQLAEALDAVAEVAGTVAAPRHRDRRRVPAVPGRSTGGHGRAGGAARPRCSPTRRSPGPSGGSHVIPSAFRCRAPHVPTGRRRRRPALLDGVRAGSGDVRGGRQVPRSAPDDRPPPADVAADELRDQPASPCARRGPPVRLRRPGQPHPTSGSSPSPRSAT